VGRDALRGSFAAELLSANGNRGRQLLAAQALTSVRLELNRLHALGLTAVTVAILFPLFYPPSLAWNGTTNDLQGLVVFFATVTQEAHARGMKVAVQSGVMFPGIPSAGSGLDVGGYYPTLSAAEFVSGRASVIGTIAGQVKPDIIDVGSEPDTEARVSGQAFVATASGYAGMVRTLVEQLSTAGLADVPIVAGTGTWQVGASAYVEELSAIPGLYGIDLHVYPPNVDYLEQALALADLAHARGTRVAVLEAWLQKERDGELGVVDPVVDPVLFARDAYSFWTPLDSAFLATMVKFATPPDSSTSRRSGAAASSPTSTTTRSPASSRRGRMRRSWASPPQPHPARFWQASSPKRPGRTRGSSPRRRSGRRCGDTSRSGRPRLRRVKGGTSAGGCRGGGVAVWLLP
jgi:hypothetical protein